MAATARKLAPSPGHIKKVHALKRALGLDDDTYRDILGRYGVTSSKDLTGQTMAACLDYLEALAVEAGVWQAQGGTLARKQRPGAASDAQVRLIKALWRQVSRQPTEKERATALDVFVRRITGKPKLAWCDHGNIQALVNALTAMGARRE